MQLPSPKEGARPQREQAAVTTVLEKEARGEKLLRHSERLLLEGLSEEGPVEEGNVGKGMLGMEVQPR